ncbi:MAG: glycosyltransferase [Geobacter sp.]|nr:glycosyltransferase [Geobacter sp.]
MLKDSKHIPRVTVLMPVYNGERFLREAIDSILAQSFTDFELLIINDGSTDGSAGIIESYGDPRIRLVHNERNLGLVATLNRGIDLARGEYLARMDADDVSLPERLERQVTYLDAHPGVGVCAVRVALIGSEGEARGEWDMDRQTTSWQEIRACLPKSNCIAHPGVMARKDLLARYRYRAEQLHAEDYDLWLRLCADGHKIGKIAEPLLRYRVHDESVTVKSRGAVAPMRSLLRVKGRYLLHRRGRAVFNLFDWRVAVQLMGDLVIYAGMLAKRQVPAAEREDHHQPGALAGFDLILFTDSFPFGSKEPFLETELEYLARRFEKILVIPFSAPAGEAARPLPGNVAFTEPLWSFGGGGFGKVLRGVFNRSPLWPHLREFVEKRVYASPRRFSLWGYSLLVARYLCAHKGLRELLAANRDALLYFYWGSNGAWTVPCIRRRNREARIVTRFHGVDLYAYRQDNAGYLPLQEAVLTDSTRAVFVCDDGLQYARRTVAPSVFNGVLFRMGVADRGMSRASGDGVFRIASCSRLVPLKRIQMIADALARLDFPVEWTHIGDGPLRPEIIELVGRLPKNVMARLLGQMPNREVGGFYAAHPVDLFVNVSESEGLPVSIMEALAAGIPVLATAVGGTSELVDDAVGRLLPAAIDGAFLAKEITAFRERYLAGGAELREAARRRWAERADAATVYDAFVAFLAGLAKRDGNGA